jgi:GPN-loop GTPase
LHGVGLHWFALSVAIQALISRLRFLLNNLDWLEEEIGAYEDDYLLIDCPGQIELYTHFTIMRRLTEALSKWGFNIAGVYCLESQFVEDKSKYFSGVLSAMSAMINLEIAHVNVMTKMDMVEGAGGDDDELETGKPARRNRSMQIRNARLRREMERYLDPDPLLLVEDVNSATSEKFHALNSAIVQLVSPSCHISLALHADTWP